MKNVIPFAFGLGLVPVSLFSAQPVSPPRIEWQSTVGGAANDWPTKVIEMPDGGFVIGGVSSSGISGNKTSPLLDTELRPTDPDENGDAWVVKLNSLGVKQWDCSYGGVGADVLVDLAPTKDR